jgi:hypothetical protein
VDAAGWTNSATATRPAAEEGTVSGRKVTTIPAAMAVTAKTAVGRRSSALRSPWTMPMGCPDSRSRSGRPGTEGIAASAAAAPAANTTP